MIVNCIAYRAGKSLGDISIDATYARTLLDAEHERRKLRV